MSRSLCCPIKLAAPALTVELETQLCSKRVAVHR